jgi:hypothetical protein
MSSAHRVTLPLTMRVDNDGGVAKPFTVFGVGEPSKSIL